MSGVLALFVGSGAGGNLSVTANDVERTLAGFAGSGTVSTNIGPSTYVTGGQSPYTYNWNRVSGSTVPAVSNSTTANPSWSGIVLDSVVESAVWRVTVIDSLGKTASVDINVLLSWFNIS